MKEYNPCHVFIVSIVFSVKIYSESGDGERSNKQIINFIIAIKMSPFNQYHRTSITSLYVEQLYAHPATAIFIPGACLASGILGDDKRS